MTGLTLGGSYLIKAEKRLKALDVLFAEEDYSDVVREAQEIVELALKGMLRHIGVEPPKQHDVGGLLLEHAPRFPEEVRAELQRLAGISKWLRKEREFAFYGDVDFIPTDEYSREDAEKARESAKFVVTIAQKAVKNVDSPA